MLRSSTCSCGIMSRGLGPGSSDQSSWCKPAAPDMVAWCACAEALQMRWQFKMAAAGRVQRRGAGRVQRRGAGRVQRRGGPCAETRCPAPRSEGGAAEPCWPHKNSTPLVRSSKSSPAHGLPGRAGRVGQRCAAEGKLRPLHPLIKDESLCF